MREDGQAVLVADQAQGVQADQPRTDQNAPTAGSARRRQTLRQQRSRRGHVREVLAVPAGGGIRPRHRLLTARQTLGERRRRLIGKAMIVLDDVDAAAGEGLAALRQFCRRQPHRLQRRAQQGTAAHPGQRTQAGNTMSRAAQRRQQRGRPFDADHTNSRLQGDIAEQQVQALRQVRANGVQTVRQPHPRAPRPGQLHRLDPAGEALGQLRRQQHSRQLDRLFERYQSGLVRRILAGRQIQHVVHAQPAIGAQTDLCRAGRRRCRYLVQSRTDAQASVGIGKPTNSG